ncbi:MAG: hypothetical protein ABRQ25_14620 [Clostridiaceae bacterium]
MDKPTIDLGKIIMSEQEKINKGLIIIILSPLLGSLLFYIYSNFIGWMISTNETVAMVWFGCILAMAILGLAMVLVGCNEKNIEQGKEKNK